MKIESNVTDLSADGDNLVTVGESLQRARASMQLSVLDIADALHITPTYVNLIEKNQFQKLPAAIFTRGYIKSYARLVNLPIDDVLALYFQQTVDVPIESQMRSSVNEYGVSVRRHGVKWAVGIILGVLFLPTLAWWYAHRNVAETITTTLAVSEPALEATTVSADIINSNISPMMDAIPDQSATILPPIQNTLVEMTAVTAVTKEIVAPIPEQAAPSKTVDLEKTQDALQINFTGKSWVQVKNIDGVMLHDAEHQAGESITIDGKSPLYVWIKNANVVAMLFNGAPVKMENIDNKGAARLVVGK
jgi:cytoskeleton protein RodZ